MANEDEKATIITTTEARQGRNVGLVRVLVVSLVLAVIVGVAFAYLY